MKVTGNFFSEGERKIKVEKSDDDIKPMVIACGLVVLLALIVSILFVTCTKKKRLSGITEVALGCFKDLFFDETKVTIFDLITLESSKIIKKYFFWGGGIHSTRHVKYYLDQSYV